MHIVKFEDAFKVMRYPAGESHVETYELDGLIRDNICIIASNVRNFEDLGNISTANEIIDRHGIHDVSWFIPYFPFGRHDRRRHIGDGMELATALDMLIDLPVVIPLDPHSDAMWGGNIRCIQQSSVVTQFATDLGLFDNDPIVVVPDNGATKKAETWIGGRDWVQGIKHRDMGTGKLSGFDVNRDNFEGRPCVIVDDICDGGGTFIGLAKVLKERGAGPLTLAVSHGLFTKGTYPLFDYFDRIMTTGSIVFSKVQTISHEDIFQRGVQL